MRGHTDIVADGWVALLPRGWAPYALLARLDRPIGAWLLFLPGLWSILVGGHVAGLAAGPTVRLVALFLAGAVLTRGAGCVINDMWDRDLDRKVTRTAGRPLASGAISMPAALVFLAVLSALGLLILLQLNEAAIRLGVSSLVLVISYPLAKRFTWWPQLMLGITFGWGAPMGFAAATGRLDAVAGLLYLAAICWILGFDTIYAHQDREDDALIGVRSTARLFGTHSRTFISACYTATILSAAASGYLAGLSWTFFVALLLPAALLARQVVLLDIDDPALCSKLFNANREVGLAVGLALLLGGL